MVIEAVTVEVRVSSCQIVLIEGARAPVFERIAERRRVELNLAGCSGLPAGEEESVAEAMLYPGPDAVAEQSALAGETGYDNALASAVSALGDVQTDAFLKESALLA